MVPFLDPSYKHAGMTRKKKNGDPRLKHSGMTRKKERLVFDVACILHVALPQPGSPDPPNKTAGFQQAGIVELSYTERYSKRKVKSRIQNILNRNRHYKYSLFRSDFNFTGFEFINI